MARTTVFTAAGRTAVLTVDISNQTGTIYSVSVWLNGVILFSISLPAFGGVSWSGPQVIDAGQKIELSGGSTSLNYYISGSL